MSGSTIFCPVCKHDRGVKKERAVSEGTGFRVTSPMESWECPVCGRYKTSRSVPEIHQASAPNRKLSAWIREQNELGVPVEFMREGMFQSILASIPDYRPLEKELKFLQALERRSGAPGDTVKLNLKEDFPLAYAGGWDECAFYLEALKERDLVRVYSAEPEMAITSAGWDYLDKHASDLEEKTQGFVAMSFSAEMKPMWEDAIKPAIQEAGYTAYRVDEELHSDNIIFKIMAEIKNSRFVVADITEQNNGAYFEAGYGLGLGLPVIWSVRKNDVENVHFDTAQYNQIRWESAEELKEGVFDYICAIIGRRI